MPREAKKRRRITRIDIDTFPFLEAGCLSEGGGESLPVRRPLRADAGGLRDGHHGKIHVTVLAIGVDIEQLSFEIQVKDLCHIARLSV